jgi:hypothetical protein
MHAQEVFETGARVRAEFDRWAIDEDVLRWLYPAWNPGMLTADFDDYLRRARESFPTGCCGLASVYLMYELKTGEPEHGRYDETGHTVLKWAHQRIADITADQFGGPEVYVGPPDYPWRFGLTTNSAEVSLQAVAHLLE